MARGQLWAPDSNARVRASVDQLRAWDYGAASQDRDYPFVVVGGGLSGVAAAVAASRRGVRTLIIEESHMLGGQAVTAGVAAFDVTFAYDRLLHGYGLWGEFIDRLSEEYVRLGRFPNTCRYRDQSFASNPVVTDLVLGQMAKESGVSVLRRTYVERGAIDPAGAELVTNRGGVKARIVVDATEDGSLLSRLSVRHRAGRLVFDGKNYTGPDPDRCGIQDITQVAAIQYYEDGLPNELRLSEPPGYSNFRRLFANNYPSDPGGSREDSRGFAGYRATPDLTEGAYPYRGSEWEKVTRTSLNYHNDHPVNASYLIDSRRREFEDTQAALKTLSLLYYLQHECGEPWGVARDEGFSAVSRPRRFAGLENFDDSLKHFPIWPYLRESKRGIGLSTLTAKDIYRVSNRTQANWDMDSVAIGTYPPDLHGGRDETDLEVDLDEKITDKPAKWREGPFGIPLGSLIHADHPNFLMAEKNISASRIAVGASRLHPTVFAIGEAVGALAAICVRRDINAHEVPSLAVQASLARGGALISPNALAVINRDDPEFAAISLAIAKGVASTKKIVKGASEVLLEVDRTTSVGVGNQLFAAVKHLSAHPIEKHVYRRKGIATT